VLVVQGTAGVGKTSLLRILRDQAKESDALVLHAQAGEYERDFPFGVARELLERWFVDASENERRSAFARAAKLAEPVFEYHTGKAADGLPDLHSTLHGLYWLCVNLSARRPLVITVDDAHWADSHSLRMIGYLAARLEENAVLLAVASGSDISGPHDDLLTAVAGSPATRVMRPLPLSGKAVHQLIAPLWPGTPAPAHVSAACHEMTGGNPFLLAELLAAAKRMGIDRQGRMVEQMRSLVPDKLSQWVHTRLRRLPDSSVTVARSMAVLGVAVDSRHCSNLSGLDPAAAQAAVQALVNADILEAGSPLRFVCPVIRTVIYSAIPSQTRAEAHSRAARELTGADIPPRLAADQLLHTPAGTDAWTVEVLRAAATQAMSEGSAPAAVRYLRRALKENIDAETRARVLGELGSAELRAHQADAVIHLTEALTLASTERERGLLGLDLAAALLTGGHARRSGELALDLARRMASTQPSLAARLAVRALVATPDGDAAKVLDQVAHVVETDASVGSAFDVLALVQRLRSCRQADELIELTQAAADHLLVADADSGTHPGCVRGWTLAACDLLPESARLLAKTAQQAAARGFVLARDDALAMRALVLAESGRLADAEAEATHLLGTPAPGEIWGTAKPIALAALLEVLVERDELDTAAGLLSTVGLHGEVPDTMAFDPVLLIRGRLKAARRDEQDGVADLLECRCRVGSRPPAVAFLPVLPHLTMALVRQGRRDEARAVVEEDLHTARTFGAARPLGSALRAAAMVADGQKTVDLLEEAVTVLDTSPSLLELAHATVDYGAALRRGGRRTDARKMLRRGVELAEKCGASALRKRGYSELVIAGGRVRRAKSTGDLQALTPAERRVADMAASGMRNQDIAKELFVTVKTIEWHLSQVYPKLGICNRVELRNALAEH
jgi:DNA-binding CsgD family transcriptional regulator